MYELIDNTLLNMIGSLNEKINTLMGSFVGIATTLAGLFALIFIGVESYKMMMGEKTLELNTLLRPFLVGLVLAFWVPFLNMVDLPCFALQDTAKELFESKLEMMEDANRARTAMQDSITLKIVKNAVNAENANEISEDEGFHLFGINISNIAEAVAGLHLFVVGKIRQLLMNVLETVLIAIWQACVYLIFFLAAIFRGILGMAGPIAFAFSLLPSWRDAWVSWLSKYVTVNLYGFFAYLVLSISTTILLYGVESDIDVLSSVNSDDAYLAMWSVYQTGYNNTFIPTVIISAVGLLLVPKVAEWIIPTSGTSSAASSTKKNVLSAAKRI